MSMTGFVSVSQNCRVVWRLGRRGGPDLSVEEALLPPHPLEGPLALLLSGPGFSSSDDSS